MDSISYGNDGETAGGPEPTPEKRPRGRPFEKGRSGNPAGRPPGSRLRTQQIAEEMLDREAPNLIRAAITRALGGDATALRLCLDRLVPARRAGRVPLALPPIRSNADLVGAMEAVAEAVRRGVITPAEAGAMARMVSVFLEAVETYDFEHRLCKIEGRGEPKQAENPRAYPPVVRDRY